MKRLLASAFLCLMLAIPAWGQDLEKGYRAYERGDYATALREWRPLAEQGDAKAQTGLGTMYFSGRGVPQDYVEALKWARKTAEQGVVEAQLLLGVMYAKGQGIPQDYVRTHMWFNLAAAQGSKDGVEGRDLVALLMTPAQVAEAQRLARKWMAVIERRKKK